MYPYRNLDDTVLENYQEILQKYKSVVETLRKRYRLASFIIGVHMKKKR